MSIETGAVIGMDGRVIYWHAPNERTVASLPDSAHLWDVIWTNRDRIAGVAHSHPGSGDPVASSTDKTTFDAIERALGRRLDWWIVSEDSTVLYRWEEPTEKAGGDYRWQIRMWGKTVEDRVRVANEPEWVEVLRMVSGY